jgi:hypothetical protein
MCTVGVERPSPHPAAPFSRVDPPPPGEGKDCANSGFNFPTANDRHCERSEAIQLSFLFARRKLDCFVALLLAMTSNRIPAARSARVVHFVPPNKGRGECRAPNAPIASRVKFKVTHELVTTGPPETPGIPARNGVTVCFALSPVSPALLPPSPAVCLRQLDTGVRVSGPHDFSVRVSAVRLWHHRVHRIPRPTFVTIAKRPFCLGGDGMDID